MSPGSGEARMISPPDGGAVNMFMKKADIVIVGADSVTSRGDLINKIGTCTLAHIARMNDVSFYSAAELSKYSAAAVAAP